MFLGEILIGIDLEGEEPGEVSKCIVYSVRGGSSVCIYTLAGTFGREVFCSDGRRDDSRS